jgi:predicted RNA-binding Zn ribbon-like protein
MHERELLGDYEALLAWARQADALGEAQAKRLATEARRRPADAAAALAEARALREAIYAAFLAFARGANPRRGDLETLNGVLGRALSHRRITRGERCCALGWDDRGSELDAPLWPVVASAAELLVSDRDLGRVRVCGLYESAECSWLFVDETKSHTRRWCSMRDCGNVAKARRHRERTG